MTAGGRAITLIELLIVLAIALAIGAVSFGGAMRWSADERLASVQQGLSSAALEARSLALSRQQPIELVAERNASGVTRVGVLIASNEGAGEMASFDAPVIEEAEERLRVLYELPADITIGTDEVDQAESGGADRVALLRVMPDGTVSMQGGSWTLTQGESVYTPAVETWTAKLSFTPEDTGDEGSDALEPTSAQPVEEDIEDEGL